MKRLILALLIGVTFLTGPALAVEPDEMLKDPALEARARALSQKLRCLVCQNETIDDSNAKLAKDLRILLRERLTAGDTDEQAVAYLVDRFGEFVLLKPRFAPHTYLLWFSPFVLLALGGFFLYRARKKSAAPAPGEAPLDEAERKMLGELTGAQKSD